MTNVADKPKIEDHFNILTHNGEITVSNSDSGNHRTFRVRLQKKGKLAGKRILSVKENGVYEAFAFVNADHVKLWKRFNNPTYRGYVALLLNPNPNPVFDFLYVGRCRVCNAKLTNPMSIVTGIGPICGNR